MCAGDAGLEGRGLAADSCRICHGFYLLTDPLRPLPFVTELLKHSGAELRNVGDAAASPQEPPRCPRCEGGRLIQAHGGRSLRCASRRTATISRRPVSAAPDTSWQGRTPGFAAPTPAAARGRSTAPSASGARSSSGMVPFGAGPGSPPTRPVVSPATGGPPLLRRDEREIGCAHRRMV